MQRIFVESGERGEVKYKLTDLKAGCVGRIICARRTSCTHASSLEHKLDKTGLSCNCLWICSAEGLRTEVMLFKPSPPI